MALLLLRAGAICGVALLLGVRLRVQTTHSGHMGWKRARHNALTTAETPVTNEQNARNYRWYETPVKCRVKCIHFVNRFFVLRGHGLNARSFHGQVPTTTSTPKVQKCMQHKHAVAGDSSTCSRDRHLILRRGVAIPHGNHVRLVFLNSSDTR